MKDSIINKFKKDLENKKIAIWEKKEFLHYNL